MSDPIERRKNDPWREEMTARMFRVEELAEHTKKDTGEIIEFFNSAKGAFNVLGWLGRIAKWVTAISAAAVVLWALVKTGLFPKT